MSVDSHPNDYQYFCFVIQILLFVLHNFRLLRNELLELLETETLVVEENIINRLAMSSKNEF